VGCICCALPGKAGVLLMTPDVCFWCVNIHSMHAPLSVCIAFIAFQGASSCGDCTLAPAYAGCAVFPPAVLICCAARWHIDTAHKVMRHKVLLTHRAAGYTRYCCYTVCCTTAAALQWIDRRTAFLFHACGYCKAVQGCTTTRVFAPQLRFVAADSCPHSLLLLWVLTILWHPCMDIVCVSACAYCYIT
jgi:hypothetical protein